MTTTYDPRHPQYLDEADVRSELTRVYDLCHGCRRCLGLCSSFPSLFEMIGRHDERDAGLLTPAQQDRVIDECFHCKLCYVNCPYTPELHAWQLDFPRLMLRAEAMRHRTRQQPVRQRVTTQLLGRADLVGRAATTIAPIVNRLTGAPAGSLARRAIAVVTGVSSVRLLPPHARQRFSTWFSRRTSELAPKRQGKVTVFATCSVEYHDTRIGKDLVRVYEHNGIECANSRAGCCGALWLHAGDHEQFAKVAKRNVEILAEEVRRGGEIVVPQPTCGFVLKHDYPDYVDGPDAVLVAEHTYDAAEYLMKVHDAADTELDTDFVGTVPEHVTYHTACHLRAQNIGRNMGLPARDLMRLTGAEVELVQQCSGIDGMWGLRVGNEKLSIPLARQLGDRIVAAGAGAVAGDCDLANTAVAEQTGAKPSHPIQLFARAYGIPED